MMQPRISTDNSSLLYQRISLLKPHFTKQNLTTSLAYSALVAIHRNGLKQFTRNIELLKSMQDEVFKTNFQENKDENIHKLTPFINNLVKYKLGVKNKLLQHLTNFTGLFKITDLHHFFESLEKSCSKTNDLKPISFILHTNNDVLTVSYSRKNTPHWTLIDAERRSPQQLTTHELIENLFSYYPASDTAGWKIDMYCHKKSSEFVDALIKPWKTQWHSFTTHIPLDEKERATGIPSLAGILPFWTKLTAQISGKIPEKRMHLHQAVQHGQYEIVRALLKAGIDADLPDSNGATSLTIAAKNKDSCLIKLLISHKADVNKTDGNGATPLHILAGSNGLRYTVDTLLEAKANINLRDNEGCTPLLNAVSNGDWQIAEKLLSAKSDPNLARDNGWAPLFIAANNGYINTTKLLLSHKANVNAICNSVTPIWFATQENHVDVTEALLEARADLHLRDLKNQTILHCLAIEGFINIVKKLLSEKVDVNACDIHGSSPLHFATIKGNKEMVLALLEARANPNLRTFATHNTPLGHAVYRNNYEITKALIDYKAEPYAPLLQHALENNENIATLLKDKGASHIPSGQSFILHGMRELAIRDERTGVCFGIICMATQEFLAGKMSDFLQRIERIARIPKDEFKKTMDTLTNDAKDVTPIREIPSFLKGIDTYQRARHYRKSFPPDQIIDSQNFKQTLPLLTSSELNPDDVICLESIEGIYTEKELTFYFMSLFDALKKHPSKVVLQLKNINHGIGLFHDPDVSPLWGMLDPNAMPLHYLSKEATAKHLMNNFGCDKTLALNCRIFVHKKDLMAMAECIQFWKNQPEWQAMHAVTAEKIAMQDNWKATWLNLAVRENNLSLTKRLLENKADPNIDNGRSPPLYVAAYNGKCDIYKLLKEYGATLGTEPESKSTSLHVAIQEGQIEMVRFLLESKSIDLNVVNKGGYTPLYEAVEQNQQEIVNLLITAYADVNYKSISFSPLGKAAELGYTDIVRSLMHAKADLNELNGCSATALYIAAQNGHTDTVKVLIEAKANAEIRHQGKMPIYTALSRGHIDIYKLLMATNLDNYKNIVDDCKNTLLICAAENGHSTVVTELLALGANIHHCNVYDKNALRKAIETGHNELARSLMLAKATMTPWSLYDAVDNAKSLYNNTLPLDFIKEILFHIKNHGDINDMKYSDNTSAYIAAREDSDSFIKLLFEAKADLEKFSTYGRNPLHAAVNANAKKVVPLLLNECKVNVHALTSYGETAAFLAAASGYTDILKTLYDAGADLAKPDKYGTTPLMKAIQREHKECVEFLLQHVDNLNVLDEEGNTALYYAVKKKSPMIVEKLIEMKADIHLGKSFNIPLMEAANSGFIDGLRMLLKNNINVNQTFISNDEEANHATLAMTAAAGNQVETFDLLIQRGADLSKTTDNGHTAFHWAAANHAKDTMAYMLDHKTSVDLRNEKSGETALIIAAKLKHVDTVGFLLRHHANPFNVDKNNHSAIYYAIQNKDWDMVKLFIHVLNLQQLSQEDQSLLRNYHKEIFWNYYQSASATTKHGERSGAVSTLLTSASIFKSFNKPMDVDVVNTSCYQRNK